MREKAVGRFSVFCRIPGVTLVSFGFLFILGIAIDWFHEAYFSEYRYRSYLRSPTEYLSCREDGTPLIFKTSMSYRSRSEEERVCRDIAGATITVSTKEELCTGEVIRQEVYWGGSYWAERVFRVSEDKEKGEVWYLKHNGKAVSKAVLEGFSLSTNLSLGFLGAEGFSNEPISDEKLFSIRRIRRAQISNRVFFPAGRYNWLLSYRERDPLSDIIFLWTDDSLFRLNLNERSIKPIVQWTADEVVQNIDDTSGLLGTGHKKEDDAWRLVVKTSKRFIEVDTEGNLQELPLLEELQRADPLRYFGKSQKGRIFSKEGCYVEEGEKVRQISTIYTLDDGGNLVSKEEVALLAVLPDILSELSASATYALFGIPGVVMTAIGDKDKGKADLNVTAGMDLANNYPVAARILGEKRRTIIQRVVIGFVITIAFALFALFWDNRYHGTVISQLTWFIYVLLFGLPGLVGYLTHRKWPARVPCAHCGTKLPVTTMVCPKCSNPVPPPEHTPKEIFA